MKVECEACGHLGAPAEILARPEGVVVVCAECGAESLMAAAGPAEHARAARADSSVDSSTVVPPAAPLPDEPVRAPAQAIVASTLAAARQTGPVDPVESLVDAGIRIDPGRGPMRCPKCGYRQSLGPACVRCGLGGRALGGDPTGWRGDVPEGKESVAAALDERWEALCDHGLSTAQADSEAFLAFSLEVGLVDRAARLVRLYAQDHFDSDEGEAARAMLGRVIEKSHAVFLVSQGGSSRDVVVERTRQTMKVLYIIVALMCVAALVLIVVWFAKAH